MIARRWLIANLAAAAVLPVALPAQSRPAPGTLKRTPLPSVLRPACVVSAATIAPPAEAKRRQARDLAARGQQAAILGDTSAAFAGLRQAEALDPTEPDLAYQLARLYESAGATDSAVKEYCRFLAVAPNVADATDARSRVAALAKPATDPAVDRANVLFGQGLRAFDAGRMAEAEERFGDALRAQPAWGDAYFDRAAARLAEGDREGAASDLELYLRLKPTADDRPAVQALFGALRRPRLSAGEAFALGVVVPGAGQFYTGRPGWGALWFVAAAGAVAYGVAPESSSSTIQRNATDPFGNPYTYPVIQQKTDRPHLVPGIALAGGIAIASAIEASLFARRTGATPAPRLSFTVVPLGGRVLASLTIR